MDSNYKILFLEDNRDDVELMEHELRSAKIDFVATQVSKKKEILDRVKEFDPNIILVDYSLPSFNGIEAYRMIKAEKPHIPFILVTGALSEQVALEFLEEGVDDFILKSSFKRLPSAIVNAVRKKDVERERHRMGLELQKSHSELMSLIERQDRAIEEERTNIARDLHDELGQVLTALKIDVSMLKRGVLSGKPLSGIEAEFKSITDLIDRITQSVKRISKGLRPEALEDLGIVEAIRYQVQEFGKRNNIECELNLPTVPPFIDSTLSITLFRIVQEALTNIMRHAQATKVRVNLEIRDDVLFVNIQDNGVGISSREIESSKSLGLIGLRERVRAMRGRFSISGGTEGGTTISVLLPLHNSENLQPEFDKYDQDYHS
jgi:two-component system, NarL family, sensor histidine kinase UhpB